MLNSISLNNFKAARNLSLPLSPLTLLAGLNGSGKSTVLQSIATIYQSSLVGDRTSLYLAGPLVALGQGRDVLTQSADNEIITISVNENDTEYVWECDVNLNSNQMELIKSPDVCPDFINTSSSFSFSFVL